MKKTILFIILIFFIQVYAQENKIKNPLIEKLISQIDSLKSLNTYYLKQLSYIKIQIDSIKDLRNTLELSQLSNKSFYSKTFFKCKLKISPGFGGDVILEIPIGEQVKVLDYEEKSGSWKILYNNKVGYIYDIDLEESKEKKALKAFYELQKKDEIQEQKEKIQEIESNPAWIKSLTANIRFHSNTNSKIVEKLRQGTKVYIQEQKNNWTKILFDKKSDIYSIKKFYKNGWIHSSLLSYKEIKQLSENDFRRREFIKSHPNLSNRFKKAIREGTIVLGMSKDMVIASWGNPTDINRTVYTWGVKEQWIYGVDIGSRTYFYFENGILKSWQD
jgi:hypothetical protein